MDPFTIGIGLAIAGTATKTLGSILGSSAQKHVIADQQRAEQIRERAMELDASRRRREMIRQGMIQRAQALATGVAQGANFGTAIPSAYAQIGGQVAFGLEGVTKNEQLGRELFATNRDLLGARQEQANAESITAIGSGLSSLGGAVIGNLGPINNLFGGSGLSDVQTGNAYRNG